MLVFHSHCQMGNQMFIYACARSLSLKRKVPYCLSELDHLKYFDLSNDDRWNNLKYLWFKLHNKIPGSRYLFEHMQDNRIDYTADMLNQISNNVWCYGYFQGEQYLFDNMPDIKSCFSIKKKFVDAYREFIHHQFGNKRLILAHIRLKDYKTFGPDFLNGPDLTLPFSYYHQNIKNILSSQPDEHYQLVFISDDIDAVKKEFVAYNGYFSNQSPIIDFQLMMHAHAAVISPSSFAWWACWLNRVEDAKIVVPEYFLGFKVKKEFPVNMIPKKFIKSLVSLS